MSGSSAITNLADTVINIEKPHIRITKNRDSGVLDYIKCCYDPSNRRIYQAAIGDRTVYGWNHEGIKPPEDQACAHSEFMVKGGDSQPAPSYPF